MSDMSAPSRLTRVTATIPRDLAEAADKLAERLGASRSGVLTDALRAYLAGGRRPADRGAVAELGSSPYARGGAPLVESDAAPTLTQAGDGALLAELARRLARPAEEDRTAAGRAGPRLSVDRAGLAELCRRHHIRRLSFFGSVLRDDFGPASDVDVLVEFEPGHVVGFEIVTVEEDLSALLGGRRVDVVIEKYLNPRLRDRVLAEAQVQYAA